MFWINELHYNPIYSFYAIKQIFFYINSMQQEVERVKILTLKDNKNKEEKYMLTSLLGKGKYGKVYKAIHVDNPKKIFAVKVISLESEKVRNQCLQQLQIIRHLPKSLNLVQIHSQHLESNNNFYLFEQFCDGGNLLEQKRYRKGKPYTENQVFNLFFQVVTGFIQLRKNNIFHEDIKPENILIKNNLYKLADFGISQLAGKIEVSAVRKGTLIYMPPQKLKGQFFTPTSKSQIFSLGVTLYQIIFGHHPYLRKKPKDYREYLKMIQQSQLKQLNLLKSIFPSPSLLIDRLIRTILRMIDISQTKRLSLEELTDYLKKTEPFTSMVISEVEPIAQRTKNKAIRYEQVGHSLIYVKSQNGIGSALVQCTKQNKNQKLKQIVYLCKQTLNLFRQISAYLQQGIFYCKNSNIYEFKKIQNESKVGLNKIAHSAELEFITLLFILRMFTQLERVTSKVILSFDLQFGQGDTLLNGIGQDKEFINNQFLNLCAQVEVEDKKEIWLNLKDSRDIAKLIANLLQQISSNITCIRINFKQDMLAFIFSMHCPKIINFAELLLSNVSNFETNEEALINLQDLMAEKSKQLMQANSILNEYSKLQALKRENVYTEFEVAVKGRQMLLDDEINSDEFEVLSLDDL